MTDQEKGKNHSREAFVDILSKIENTLDFDPKDVDHNQLRNLLSEARDLFEETESVLEYSDYLKWEELEEKATNLLNDEGETIDPNELQTDVKKEEDAATIIMNLIRTVNSQISETMRSYDREKYLQIRDLMDDIEANYVEIILELGEDQTINITNSLSALRSRFFTLQKMSLEDDAKVESNGVIDVNNWDEDDHPELAKDLLNLVNELETKLQNPQYDPRSARDIDALSEMIKKFSEELLDLDHGLYSSHANRVAIANFLRRRYLSHAHRAAEKLGQRVVEIENQKFTEWCQNLDDVQIFKDWLALITAPNPPSPPTTDPGLSIRLLDAAKTAADAHLVSMGQLDQKQQEYVENKYNKAHQAKMKILEAAKKEFDSEQEVDAFNLLTRDLRNLLDTAPTSTSGTSKAAVESLLNRIETAYNSLESAGHLSRKSNDRVNAIIESIKEKYTRVTERLRRLLLEFDQPKNISEMTFTEICQELLTNRLDPFLWGDWKVADPSREKDLVNAYIRRAFSPITSDPEPGHPDQSKEAIANRIEAADLERVTQKLRVQLITLDNKLIHETGKASGHRGLLYEQIGERQIARNDIVAAATFHPEWGKDVRDMLKYVIEKAAIDPNRPRIPGRDGGDDVPRLKYESLAGEKGRDNLAAALLEEWPGNQYRQAREFAQLLFTSFDMLTISLQELCLQTKTRAHNGGIEDIDRVSLRNPVAGYVHAGYRYGGNAEDYRAWFLVYAEDLPNGVGAQEAGGTGIDSTKIKHKQHMLKAHQEIFYPIDNFAGKIPLPDFCQSIFPDEWDAAILYPGETARVGNRVIDENGNTLVRFVMDEIRDNAGNVVGTIRGGKVFDQTGREVGKENDANVTLRVNGNTVKLFNTLPGYDMFAIAEMGWSAMLDLTYKSLPEKLTIDQIVTRAGGGQEKSLLGKWLGEAGKAKIFPGDHLKKALVPMLTHFIYRLFSNFIGDGRARVELFHKVIEELEHTKRKGGLDRYVAEVDQVIANLRGPRSSGIYKGMNDALRPGSDYRDKERINYAIELWEEEHPGRNHPPTILAWPGKLPDWLLRGDQEHFLQIVRGEKLPKLPANRSGNLLQIDENKSH